MEQKLKDSITSKIEVEQLRAKADGYETVGTNIDAADLANDLPLGEHEFEPYGTIDDYGVKRISVPTRSTSDFAGQKIQMAYTKGIVIVGADRKKFPKNLGGIHTETVKCYVTKNGDYNRLTAYIPKEKTAKVKDAIPV